MSFVEELEFYTFPKMLHEVSRCLYSIPSFFEPFLELRGEYMIPVCIFIVSVMFRTRTLQNNPADAGIVQTLNILEVMAAKHARACVLHN